MEGFSLPIGLQESRPHFISPIKGKTERHVKGVSLCLSYQFVNQVDPFWMVEIGFFHSMIKNLK